MPGEHPNIGPAPAVRQAADADHDSVTPPPSGVHTAGMAGLPTHLPARLGRYTLLSMLGKGGMGAVYLADDTHLNRRVALKVPHLAGADADAVRVLHDRFLREARMAAGLSHPNLCPVHDCGEIDGVLYMAMAYLEGKPLSKFVRTGQPLPVRAVLTVVRQLAVAMQEAHAKGVIHRDLKPSNIMVTPSRQPVIMDFGLARRTDIEDTRLTRSGLVVGTPAYMPPEQLNCDTAKIGPATDIYALGVILYELLAGRPPFQGPFGALMAQIMIDPPPPLSRWRPEIDSALDGLCGRALAKAPQDRFPSMRSFANSLDEYLKAPSRPVAVSKPVITPPAPAAKPKSGPPAPLDEENAATLFNEMAAQQVRLGATPRPHTAPHRRPRRRRRFHLPEWLIPMCFALAVLLGGFMALSWFLQHMPHRRDAPASSSETNDDKGSPDGSSSAGWADAPEKFRTAFERLRRDPTANGDSLFVLRDFATKTELRKTVPAGPALEVGKFLAFVENDWLRAGVLIRHSENRPWMDALAKDEAARADTGTGADRLAAGDVWWVLAAKDSEFGERIRRHARKRYREAMPGLPSGPEHHRAAERAASGD